MFLTLVLLEPDIYVFKKVSAQINATAIDKIFSGRCSANQIFQFGRCLFFLNENIFRHLKLEIALAIPALKEWKIIWNNLAGHGLRWGYYIENNVNMLKCYNMLKCH